MVANRFEDKTWDLQTKLGQKLDEMDSKLNIANIFLVVAFSTAVVCGTELYDMRRNRARRNVSPQKATESKILAATKEQFA